MSNTIGAAALVLRAIAGIVVAALGSFGCIAWTSTAGYMVLLSLKPHTTVPTAPYAVFVVLGPAFWTAVLWLAGRIAQPQTRPS